MSQPTEFVAPFMASSIIQPTKRQIIGHRLFQRLRYIRQLALTELVYPGATHSRLEHVLGVMEVATAAFDMLSAKHGERLEAEFQIVAGFETKPLAMSRQVLRIAALLHDVGHAAFSHAAEEVVHADLGHEHLSAILITRPDFLGSVLDGLYGVGFAQRVAEVLQGPPKLPPQLQVLNDLVSGEMDADRTDYLIRDSYHCGVNYGRFEYRRLIESIALDGTGRLELALHRDGLHAFEALILARYQMNTQVYYHRLRRVYDTYLVRYHLALGAEAFNTPEKIIAENDMTMLSKIMTHAVTAEHPGHVWAKRIANRQHHKVVFEPGIHVVGGHDLSCVPKVLKDMRDKYDGVDFFADSPSKPIRIHKLLMPSEEPGAGVDMMLISGAGDPKPVVRSSQIFSTIPKSFRQIRIFCDVESKATRKEMSQFAASKWASYGGTV